MKRLITLSLSLVAFSAGAGLGLSAIHHYAMSEDTALLSAPEGGTQTGTGFVLPDHVPAISEAAVVVPTLPEPEVSVEPIIVPQPVVKTPAPEMSEPALAARPNPAAPMARQWPEPTNVPNARTRAKALADFDAPRSNSDVSRNNFVARVSPEWQPDYVVGVYR